MSNFKVWIDTPTAANTQTAAIFAADAQRTNGFIAATAISSIRVNTALRQATLVMAALMDTFASASTTGPQSTLAAVTTDLINGMDARYEAKASTIVERTTAALVTYNTRGFCTGFAAQQQTPASTAGYLLTASGTAGSYGTPIYQQQTPASTNGFLLTASGTIGTYGTPIAATRLLTNPSASVAQTSGDINWGNIQFLTSSVTAGTNQWQTLNALLSGLPNIT